MDDSNMLLWIHISGQRIVTGDGDISHMGRNLQSYPFICCHVFAKLTFPLHEVSSAAWIRVTHLGGKSAFVGMNYMFILDAPGSSEHVADNALPLFQLDCVFAAHVSSQQRPEPRPDWIRVDVTGPLP
jgi:hypothetical protein